MPAIFRRAFDKLSRPNAASFYFLFLMWAFLTLFYYFGELVNYAHWDFIRWSFFYSVHDIHRLLFLAPILYAAYIFGSKATIIITIISLMTFLPRALFVSTYPDSIARMAIFVVAAGLLGHLTVLLSRERKRRIFLEKVLQDQLALTGTLLETTPEGVMIIGPDYKVRYNNPAMVREFGDMTGASCYQKIIGSDQPCSNSCRLPSVLTGNTERWEYSIPDGKKYQVISLPYQDTDGTVCMLSRFSNITP